MAEQEEDFSSLPLPDRFAHKNWKVRKAAYEDAAKEFEKTPDEHAPAFQPFLRDPGLWKGAVIDSNVAAQQDGINALCAFLKFGGKEQCTRTRGQTVTGLVEKGLPSTRAATKASALEAILLYVELDNPAPIIEDILPGLSNKQPKVVAATLAALTTVYHNYGCKTVDPKPVLKVLPKAFSHADKNVRAEATNLAVEFYRWLREAMKPMFWNDLKPTQQTDMDAQFEKIKSEPAPKQERFLRSQQAAMARAPPPGAEGEEAEDDAEDEPVEVDVFDLAEPQDIKMPAGFFENLASSKWKERKEALEALYTAVNVPRIKDGDYHELARGLAKCMKDANVAVVTNAAQCIEVLAKGLRKGFGKYKATVLQPILERLKEKKATVTDALGAALDQVFIATSLTDCLEDIIEFLKHKNPQVKEGTMKFLIRSLRTTRDAPTKPETAQIVEAGKKLLSESSEGLRSGGAEVLGTLMKIMGERAMTAHFEGLDDIRKTKIKEFFDTAEVKAKDKPKPPPPAAAPPKAVAPAAGKKVVTKKPAAAKKPVPASIYAQTAPLAPQPTARSIAAGSKLSKPGLKAPLKKTIAAPASPPQLTSPQRRPPAAAAAPIIDDDDDEPPPPQPRLGGLGRGLAGRPLGKPVAAAPPAPEPAAPPGMSAAERAELDELRLEKERLVRQNEDLRSERSRLHSEVQELKNQNAQLIEDHTRDVLSIKAKETQLVRARSDAEAAEAQSAQLRREMERLKRALTAADRASAASGLNNHHTRESVIGSPDRGGEDRIYRDRGMYGGGGGGLERDHSRNGRDYRSGMSFDSSMSEEKQNGDSMRPPYPRSKLSPDYSQASGHGSSASNSRRDSPSRDLPPARTERVQGEQSDQSWKRAAEVTSALRLRIEQMKPHPHQPAKPRNWVDLVAETNEPLADSTRAVVPDFRIWGDAHQSAHTDIWRDTPQPTNTQPLPQPPSTSNLAATQPDTRPFLQPRTRYLPNTPQPEPSERSLDPAAASFQSAPQPVTTQVPLRESGPSHGKGKEREENGSQVGQQPLFLPGKSKPPHWTDKPHK